MMTTADTYDNTHSPIKEDTKKKSIASPLAMGSGQIRPNQALDPGLIYDATPQDYVNLLCSMNLDEKQIMGITRSRNYNCSNPSSDFNYPAFVVSSCDNRTSIVQNFKRIVTNVGEGATTYKANVTLPEGSTVIVSPTKLIFRNKYEKQSYAVTISFKGNNNGEVSFGDLIWEEENGNHTVRSPIVISPTHDGLPTFEQPKMSIEKLLECGNMLIQEQENVKRVQLANKYLREAALGDANKDAIKSGAFFG
ncbi:Subtilisin-like protease [Fagus crenata]